MLTLEVFYLLAAPDSPVEHRTVRATCRHRLSSDFWYYRLRMQSRSRPLGEVDRCFIVSPDSPMNFSGRALGKPESS
jgi:hypothetical protein